MQYPFTGGIDNLKVIFEKSARQYQTAISSRAQGQSLQSIHSHTSSSKEKISMRRKDFLKQFVRLHGMMFFNSLELHKSTSNRSRENEKEKEKYGDRSSKRPNSILNDQILSLFPMVLDEFDQLLQLSTLKGSLLMRFLVICLFSVHFGALDKEYFPMLESRDGNVVNSEDGNRDADEKSERDASPFDVPRKSNESVALIFLYGLISKYAQEIVNLFC